MADNIEYAFNEFLQLGIEHGLIGLSLMLLFIYAIIRNTKISDPVVMGAMASLSAVFVCCLASYPLHIFSVLVNCVFFIAIAATSTQSVPKQVGLLKELNLSAGLIMAVLALTCWAGVSEYKRFSSLNSWEKAAQFALEGNVNQAFNIYSEVYPSLSKHGKFLYNYGSELIIAGESNTGIKILETSKQVYSHSNIYLYLGNGYESLGNYLKAEQCYLKAMSMVPSRFLPKYQLFQLYTKFGVDDKCRQIARQIVYFPVKIESVEVKKIKSHAQAYLQESRSRDGVYSPEVKK